MCLLSGGPLEKNWIQKILLRDWRPPAEEVKDEHPLEGEGSEGVEEELVEEQAGIGIASGWKKVVVRNVPLGMGESSNLPFRYVIIVL